MTLKGFWTLKKLLFTFILILFIPLLFSLLYSGYNQYHSAIDKAKRDTLNLISLFRKEQVDLIRRTEQFLSVLALVPSVRNLDFKSCDELFKSVHKQNSVYSTIVLVDRNGILRSCSIPLKKTLNVSDRPWFKRITESRKFIVDNFIISRSSGKASLPLAYPVLDERSEFEAAVGAAIDLKIYEALFEKIPLPEDSLVFVTDSNGTLLYSNRSGINITGHPFKIKVNKNSTDNHGSFERSDSDGISRIFWYETVSLGDKSNGISILIGVSKKKLFEKIKKNFVFNLAALILMTVFFLSLSWFAGEHLFLNPIKKLIEKTSQVKEGNFSELNQEGNLTPEFSILNSSFNSMIIKLGMREKERDDAFSTLRKELDEKNRIEKELRDREAHLSILFEKAADAIYVSSVEGALINVNKAACALTGYSKDELVKMNVFDLDAKIKSIDVFSRYVEKMILGEPALINSKHRRKDGSTYHVEITMSLFSSNDKKYVIGIARDTTERKRMEKRIKQAQKMESVGNLAGGIAHDFNNLLFPILATSEMLMEKFDENSKVYKGLKNIFDAADRSSELVKQILTFSSQSKQKRVQVQLQRVLKDVLKLTRSTIPSYIDVEQKIDGKCGKIMADPTQIHQLLMNLITNAYHAIENQDSGVIAVELNGVDIDEINSTHLNLVPGKYAVLKISDSGCGIDPEVMDKIFDPYFTTKERGKGTGLGLSTVYGIVREYSGAIKVSSVKGNGAVFTVYFPVSESGPENEEIKYKKNLPGGDEKILFVDDEKMIVQLAEEILVLLGYKVKGISDSVLALEIFKNDPEFFDLVITDMTMPKITGDRLAAEILSIRPDIPIIICTGFSERIDRVKAEKMGIKEFIMKPVTGAQIAETVRKVLDKKND